MKWLDWRKSTISKRLLSLLMIAINLALHFSIPFSIVPRMDPFSSIRVRSFLTLLCKYNLIERIIFNFFVLGDEIYPLQPDYEGGNYDSDVYADKTREELRNMHKNIHRLEGDIKKGTIFFCNIALPNGHINPVYDDSVSTKKCKL